MNNRSNLFLTFMLLLFAAGACNSPESAFEIGGASRIDALHAPWDGLEDVTTFRCHADQERFYFHYEVVDSTLTLLDPYEGERTVDWEDRVEIFFSQDADMTAYFCGEIDPMGRRMDYSSSYKCPLDYEWNFSTMRQAGQVTDQGYIVAGSVAISELAELGVDLKNGFYLGVFRADFHQDGSVNWYSAVKTDDESPYFHKPNVLFPARIK